MKAIVQDRYGSPDVLELREIDRPVNGDDHVLVRVHAAGVDQGVWHEVAGLPYLFRIAGIGVRAPSAPALKNCGLRGQVGELLQRREPLERLALELPDAFARQVELKADRIERPGLALEAEPQLDDPTVPFGERVERFADVLAP